jgi:histidine triad (HIT) family protein
MVMTSDCLFCKMASGELDAPKLHDDALCFAIRDISPRAPVHVLVVPKEHIAGVRELDEGRHAVLLSRLLSVANDVADAEGIAGRGYRLAFNCGDDGGQTIEHLHLHLLGGRRLGAEG